MPAQSPAKVAKILVVCYEERPFKDVKNALAYLGDVVTVRRVVRLHDAAELNELFDVVVLAASETMRQLHMNEIAALVRDRSVAGSVVFVIGPLSNGWFVADMIAAGAKNVISESYDVAVLRQVLTSVLPATCEG